MEFFRKLKFGGNLTPDFLETGNRRMLETGVCLLSFSPIPSLPPPKMFLTFSILPRNGSKKFRTNPKNIDKILFIFLSIFMQIYTNENFRVDISETEIMVVNCSDLEIDSGALYGFFSFSAGMIWTESSKWLSVNSSAYFSLSGKSRVICQKPYTKNFFICVKNEKPFFHLGFLEEGEGRLKYIDGCTDSLLISPVKRGMPCLNHLHFPKHTEQTFHTHPSYRAGIVAYGSGVAARSPATGPISLSAASG